MHFTIIGWIGMILFLVNYALVSNGKLVSTGKAFNVIQVIAAIAIAVSLLPAKAWPTIVLEIFFVIIGLIAIFKKK